MASAVITELGSVGSSISGNNITAILKRQKYSDVWPATFTRSSAAYDDTLALVASGLPRFGENGVKVEEGTQNILPSGSELFNTSLWGGYNGETLSFADYPIYIPELKRTVTARRITGTGNGSSTIKFASNAISGLTSGRSTAVSVYAMSLNSAITTKIGDLYGNAAAYSAISTASMQRVVSAQSYASVYSRFIATVSAATDVLDIVVYAPGIELKAYATSWHIPGGTRAAETLTVPSSNISAAAGCVEFTALVNSRTKLTSVDSVFWAVGGGVYTHGLRFDHTNNLYRIAAYSDAGASVTATCADSLVAEGLASFKINWDAAGFYVWGNGAKIITLSPSAARPGSFAANQYFGCRQDGASYCSTYFSNIRAAKTTRSDAEMAYTGNLKSDQYTTFFRPYKII